MLTAEHRTAMAKFLTTITIPARLALLDEGSGTSSPSHTACLVSALSAENVSLIQKQQREEDFGRAFYAHQKISFVADMINEFGQSNLERLLNLLQPEFGHSTDCSKAFESALAVVTLSTVSLSKPAKKGW